MSDEYLWNKSGPPDLEVARLEKLLGRFAHQPEMRTRRLWWRAAAAMVLAAAAGGYWFETTRAVTSWELTTPGRAAIALRRGAVVDTASGRVATVASKPVGTIEVAPRSRLRLLGSRAGGEQRFALEHGQIRALIWAPPAEFLVDTPSARTVDLGCQYVLSVADDGTGYLQVETGWVAFEWRDVESFIPAGAACRTRPGHGPDTPAFLDAPASLVRAVARFDEYGDWETLREALPRARERDGLTLWHLLRRTAGARRGEVFDRLAGLVTLPPAASREAILRGDALAFDAAWNALDLGGTGWWREWKRKW